jgi:hypothetical protein
VVAACFTDTDFTVTDPSSRRLRSTLKLYFAASLFTGTVMLCTAPQVNCV